MLTMIILWTNKSCRCSCGWCFLFPYSSGPLTRTSPPDDPDLTHGPCTSWLINMSGKFLWLSSLSSLRLWWATSQSPSLPLPFQLAMMHQRVTTRRHNPTGSPLMVRTKLSHKDQVSKCCSWRKQSEPHYRLVWCTSSPNSFRKALF